MKKRILFPLTGLLVFLGFVSSCLVFTTSCKNGTGTEVDTVAQNIFICSVYAPSYLYGGVGRLTSDPLADPASSDVRIKWDTYNYVFSQKKIYPFFLDFDDTDTTLHPIEKEYTIELTSNVGNCNGKITLPAKCAIIQPKDGDTLPSPSLNSIYCEWSTATGATFYYVSYFASAYDYSGNYVGDCEDKEVFTTATSLTIPNSYFNISAAYYSVDFFVSPCSGPYPQPGASGNMSGSIKGFLTGVGRYESISFYAGTPVKGKLQIKEHTPQDKMKAYIKALGIEVE